MSSQGASFEEDWEVAQGCFRHLKTMFQELEECRAFELLKVVLVVFGWRLGGVGAEKS